MSPLVLVTVAALVAVAVILLGPDWEPAPPPLFGPGKAYVLVKNGQVVEGFESGPAGYPSMLLPPGGRPQT